MFFSFVVISIFILKEQKSSSLNLQNKNLPKELRSVWDDCKKNIGCLRQKVKPLLSNYGLTKIINAADQAYGSSCHDQAHIIGQIAGENEKDVSKILGSCTSQCGYGCYHGVILGAFNVSGNSLLNNLSSICQQYSSSSFPGQNLSACRHGLGHGLAELTGFNPTKTASYCDRLADSRAKEECATGMLMEIIDNSITDPSNPRIKIPENISDVCKPLSGMYSDICLLNIASYEYKRSQNGEKAFRLCKTIPSKIQNDCAQDLGTDFHFILSGDAENIWKACSIGDGDQIRLCIKGALFSSLVTDSSGKTGLNLCRRILKDLQPDCFNYLINSIDGIHGESGKNTFCNQLDPKESKYCIISQ